jgi:hypothetical protein
MRITIYITLQRFILENNLHTILHIILYLLQFLQFQYSHLTPLRTLHIEDDIQDRRFFAENRNTLSLHAIFFVTHYSYYISIFTYSLPSLIKRNHQNN